VVEVIGRDIPQSVMVFGFGGIKRDDPDFIPAYVMNFILGEGGFGSRLMEEVREKRGLTYGIYTSLVPFDHAGAVKGSVSTMNERAKETIDITRAEIARMASEGPTQQELDEARTYITGSYPLRFDSNRKIASQLNGIQRQNLGIDYVNRRNRLIDAVTVDDIKRVAKRLLDADGMISRHLQPLLDRIYQMLGTGEAEATALLKRVKIIGSAKRPVPSRFFELVGESLLTRRRLHMRYLTRGRGEVSEREVSPQRLVHYRNTWYVDAWCHARERLLRFALDAIEHASTLETRAKEVPLKQVEAEMDGGYGIYAGARRHVATLRFQAQAAPWVSREQWHPDQRGRWLDDGRYELELPYADETEIVMDILRQGPQVEVVKPASLRKRVGDRLREASEVYSG